jgi:predicted transcriptional regulator
MTDSEIINFIRDVDDPVVTASDIAEEFDVSNQAVNHRLGQLAEEDKVVRKNVGASAVVWYLRG